MFFPSPRHSTYGIFTYIGVVWWVNVGKYAIHGVFPNDLLGCLGQVRLIFCERQHVVERSLVRAMSKQVGPQRTPTRTGLDCDAIKLNCYVVVCRW